MHDLAAPAHPVKKPVLPSPAPEYQFLFDWLVRGARRIRARHGLADAGWVVSTVLACVFLYLSGQRLGLPGAVLTALTPLLMLSIAAVVVLSVWRCTRGPALRSVAAEADTRAGLNDELASACWFAGQPTPSSWEVLMLRRAAHTARSLDLRTIFPLPLPRSFAAAAALGTVVLALSVGAPGLTAPTDSGRAPSGNPKSGAGTAVRALAPDSTAGLGVAASATAAAEKANAWWARAEALAQSLKSGETQAQLRRAIEARDLKRVQELAGRAEQEIRGASAGPDARARAGQVAAEVAEGLLQRLQALLEGGSEPKTGEAVSTGDPEAANPPAPPDGAGRRDAETHTTMDALNDALRALGQAATGDQPMGNSPPGPGSQNNARINISGGAEGMRVNTSQAGEGGEDTPPEAPSEGLGEPIVGKPTARLAASVQRLDSAPGQADAPALGSEGAYAATQAQNARVGLAGVQASRQGASDAAIAREQIPVAYRASVKRYFLTEHGKEP